MQLNFLDWEESLRISRFNQGGKLRQGGNSVIDEKSKF